MKRAIFGIAANAPRRDTSHAAGWAKKWSELLDADIVVNPNDLVIYDELFIWNDINGEPGKVNLFGFKLDNEVGTRVKIAIKAVERFAGPVYQLDYQQDYYTSLTKRGLDVPESFRAIPSVTQEQFGNRICIGDSHSISVAPTNWSVNRNDGKTLRGALKKGLESYIPDNAVAVRFKFGDIDLRHHAARKEDCFTYIGNLAFEYARQLMEIKRKRDCGVEVVIAMPQTPDSRKIPATGFFDGTPFFGSLELRQMLTECFNEALSEELDGSGVDVIGYNDEYYDEDGLLDVTKMEAKQSFHLAPKWYIG